MHVCLIVIHVCDDYNVCINPCDQVFTGRGYLAYDCQITFTVSVLLVMLEFTMM